MDPITHFTAGYFLGRRWGAGTEGLRAMTLCTLLPDIDFLIIFWGYESLGSIHRSATHSIVGLLIIALLVASVYVLWKGEDTGLQVLPWCMAGVLSHLVLDLFSYSTSLAKVIGLPGAPEKPDYLEGIQLFWPWSDTHYSIVNEGILTQELTGYLMILLFFLGLIYLIRRTMKGDPPWRIWTGPISAWIGGKKEK